MANWLTAFRVCAAPALVFALLQNAHAAALALFALAVASDLLDGPLARARGSAGPRGVFFDHGSDALFVSTGCAALAWRGDITHWLAPAIALAFLQYAFGRTRAPAAPSRLGRWNGIAYFVLLGTPIVRDALALGFPGARAVAGFAWLLLASTLLSMALRLRRV